MTRIPAAPEHFDGSLSEFYEDWASKVLLPVSSVQAFHEELVTYLASADPLFLTRMVRGQERGAFVRNRAGHRLRATDNSPAWWIHSKLFQGLPTHADGFPAFIESVPCHMFEIRLPASINSAGWHVAHIFDAKDRNTAYDQWNRAELVRRMVRNIHPCNYFYIPKVDWQRWGGDPVVVAFFYEKFAERYRSVWDEFLDLVDGSRLSLPPNASEYRYYIPLEAVQDVGPKGSTGTRQLTGTHAGATDNFAARYTFSRLAFKADVIEALGMDEMFCIDTPEGSYAMTKRDFYEVFPLVPASKSYSEDRLYSYPKPPRRAAQFRLNTP